MASWYRRDASFNSTGKPSGKPPRLHLPTPDDGALAWCTKLGSARRIVLIEEEPIEDPDPEICCARCLRKNS